jgi:hypothetical protein
MPTELEEEVGEALAQECREIFGSSWSNEIKWKLARAAIAAVGRNLLGDFDEIKRRENTERLYHKAKAAGFPISTEPGSVNVVPRPKDGGPVFPRSEDDPL